MIPAQAVEAAAENLYVSEHGPWDGVSGITSAHLTRARAALEAAAPYIRAHRAIPRDMILEVLNSHVQSARNGRCECGWRATYPDPRYPIGAEHFQHREHLADEIAAALT